MRAKLIYNILAFLEDGSAKKFKVKGVNLMKRREIYLRNSFLNKIARILYLPKTRGKKIDRYMI